MVKKFTEANKVNVVGASQTWFDMANYAGAAAIVSCLALDSTETVTVQLRKATSSAGANAANWGAAVVGTSAAAATDLAVTAEGWADSLGYHTDGTPFTHVSATSADTGDTETAAAPILIRFNGRYGATSA